MQNIKRGIAGETVKRKSHCTDVKLRLAPS